MVLFSFPDFGVDGDLEGVGFGVDGDFGFLEFSVETLSSACK